MTKTVDGIVIRREEKEHHGIGWIVIAAGASIAAIVLAVVLLGFLGVSTETGLAGPSGGGLLAGAVTVTPSDEPGETIYSKDKSYSVTTIVIGTEAIKYSGGKSIAPVISDIEITKMKDVSNRGDFRVFFKAEGAAGTRMLTSDNVKDLYIVKYYGSNGNCGSGTTFPLYQGKTIYLRIVGKNQHASATSGIFKVTYRG